MMSNLLVLLLELIPGIGFPLSALPGLDHPLLRIRANPGDLFRGCAGAIGSGMCLVVMHLPPVGRLGALQASDRDLRDEDDRLHQR